MFITSSNRAVVSTTDLIRKYKAVKALLKKNFIVIVTNRNDKDEADGIYIPYSQAMIDKLEDIAEDVEIEANKKSLLKEIKKSDNSARSKTIGLEEL